MTTPTSTTITFTAGRYHRDQSTWEPGSNAPTVSITEALFRVIFDAAGEETIDTNGDVDPGFLLGLVGPGLHSVDDAAPRLRLFCR